ncbi:von Willebrand factor A domain-containing protein 7-like [Scyliorhinus canicula]|uniref:von Willebrand factor A domain-containing protein 7-like n=1 Tax=Scyliorhinus canicula TaxID=7830 RepID=UPI0018F3E838|nr:von Willebrand factor A domain-containing protein 7-like [Scyliorhinus canicula]
MSDILSRVKLHEDNTVLQYVDDVLIAFKTEDGHKAALYSVLKGLADAGLRVSPHKAQIAKPQVLYLGHLISQGIKEMPVDRKITIKEMLRPVTVRGVRKVLGLFNYSGSFIPDFAKIAERIQRLVKGGKPALEGQSLIDFSFSFIEPFDGPHPGFTSISGQPISGRNATLVISVTGLSAFHNSLISHVLLLDVNGENLQVANVLNPTESDQTFMVDIEMVPRESFFLLVQGQDGMGNVFRRQSSTLISTSQATLTVQDKEMIESGQDFNLTFTLKSEAPSSIYNLVVRDDQNFSKRISPSRVSLQEGESIKGVAFFSIPDHTPAGTTMTIIIEASSTETSDFNYGLLRLTVTNCGTQRGSKSSIYCQIASFLILSLLVSTV